MCPHDKSEGPVMTRVSHASCTAAGPSNPGCSCTCYRPQRHDPSGTTQAAEPQWQYPAGTRGADAPAGAAEGGSSTGGSFKRAARAGRAAASWKPQSAAPWVSQYSRTACGCVMELKYNGTASTRMAALMPTVRPAQRTTQPARDGRQGPPLGRDANHVRILLTCACLFEDLLVSDDLHFSFGPVLHYTDTPICFLRLRLKDGGYRWVVPVRHHITR